MRWASVLAGAALLAGCSAEWFKQSADSEVRNLVRDRELRTLSYEPKTPIAAPVMHSSAKPAYARIPVSPVPPPQPPAVEAVRTLTTLEPMGPELKWMRDWPAPDNSAPIETGQDGNSARRIERLRPGPPSPFNAVRRVDLFGSLHLGIEHSRQYQDQLENLYLSALDVTLQRHMFAPTPFLNTGLQYQGGQGQSNVAYRSAMLATANAGVKKKLPFGGQVVASTLVQFVDALDNQSVNGESAQLALNASIPLLRGAGLVNLEALIESERTLVYRVRSFEEYRRQFVVNVASQYFKLLAAQQSVNNRQVNIRNNQDILQQSEAMFAANRINFLEVQRARQAVLQAQAALLSSQQSYESLLDNFKLTLGLPVEEELIVMPVRLDVNVPRVELADATSLAEKYRLDLQTARDQIDDARRQVKNAENGLLPDVTLTAGSTVGNIAGTPGKSLDGRTTQYNAGVAVDWPLDRLAERNSYRSALIGLSQSQRSLQTQTEQIRSDVRNSLRQIRTAELSLQIQRRAIELAQRRLEYSTALFRLGRVSSSRDLVEAQSSLLTAQDAYESARSDLQVFVLQFLRISGTLRVDPSAGTLGQVLNDADPDFANPKNSPLLDSPTLPNLPAPQGPDDALPMPGLPPA